MSDQKKLTPAAPMTNDPSMTGGRPGITSGKGPSVPAHSKKQTAEVKKSIKDGPEFEASSDDRITAHDGLAIFSATAQDAPVLVAAATAPADSSAVVYSDSGLLLAQLNLPTEPATATPTAASGSSGGFSVSSIFSALSLMGLAAGGGGG